MSQSNSTKLLQLESQARLNGWHIRHPNTDFCYYIAEKTGELGNDNPSDAAIALAEMEAKA